MSVRLRLPGLFVCVILLVGAPTSAAAPVRLEGTWVVSPARTGSALVRVPEPARTRPRPDGTGAIRFDFAGEAFFRALAIVAEQPDAEGDRYAAYVDGSLLPGGSSFELRDPLPAGDYRLYVVTDGRPATIRITMPYGEGERSLELPDPATVQLHEMKRTARGVVRASASSPGPGVLFGVVRGSYPPGRFGTREWCTSGGESADTDAAYAPGCSLESGPLGLIPSVGGTDFEIVDAEVSAFTEGESKLGFGGTVVPDTPPDFAGVVGSITFSPPTTPVSLAVASARILSTRVTVRAGRAPVKVRCDGPGRCQVRLQLPGATRVENAVVAPHATRRLTLRLGAKLRADLRRFRSVTVRAKLTVLDSGEAVATTQRRVTLQTATR